MKIIVTATHKGGEGKTTNCIILAEYFAMVMKKKVLAIDLDPQANFSGRYLSMSYDPTYQGGKFPPLHPDYDAATDLDWDGRSTIADIFYGVPLIPYPTLIPELDLLPAYSSKLQDAEAVTKSEVTEKVHVQLKKFFDFPEVRQEYDIIIIDTPPSKGPLTISAVKAATHMVIPSQMEQFSIEGIYGMLQLWKQEAYSRGATNSLELIGILPNQVRDINLHKSFLESLKNMKGVSDYVMPFVIKKRAVYAELLVEGANPKMLFELPANNIARQEYEIVCKHIAERVYG